MAYLRDIYFKVGKDLYTHAFDIEPDGRKKKLVDACLKTYLASKIAEESTEQALVLSDKEDVSVDDLVEMLGDLIPEEEHFDSMRHLTHFLLNIAGEMQGWSITWWDEQDEQFIDNPLIKFNEAGKIESLTTHKQSSYVQTFKFVHDVFTNSFMNEKTQNKQFTLKDIRQGSNN